MNDSPVLVVDDSLESQEIVTGILEEAGYEVFTAPDGSAAFNILSHVSFPIVITGSEIPELDGLEICRRIRAQESGEYTYIILHSPLASKGDIAAGLAAGADQILVRPIDPQELLGALESAARILTMERALKAKNDELQILSTTDSLTGSYNRRFLEKQFPAEIERCLTWYQPLSVILCDIDHFKMINDRYGYSAGDFVLARAVNLLEKTLRKGVDRIIRYGGDEFLIFLPNTKLWGAYQVAQRMKQVLAEEVFQFGERSIRLTGSFGLAGLDPHPANIRIAPEWIFEKSCRSLRRAKMEGGNRIKIYISKARLTSRQRKKISA